MEKYGNTAKEYANKFLDTIHTQILQSAYLANLLHLAEDLTGIPGSYIITGNDFMF